MGYSKKYIESNENTRLRDGNSRVRLGMSQSIGAWWSCCLQKNVGPSLDVLPWTPTLGIATLWCLQRRADERFRLVLSAAVGFPFNKRGKRARRSSSNTSCRMVTFHGPVSLQVFGKCSFMDIAALFIPLDLFHFTVRNKTPLPQKSVAEH